MVEMEEMVVGALCGTAEHLLGGAFGGVVASVPFLHFNAGSVGECSGSQERKKRDDGTD